jgi:hypothetical protein
MWPANHRFLCLMRTPTLHSCRFNAFPGSDYQAYIHTSKYARWREDLGRRESWPETVDRRDPCTFGAPATSRESDELVLLNIFRTFSLFQPCCTEANINGLHNIII